MICIVIYVFQIVGMAIQVVEFQTECMKLERFLPKNQHTQRKFLNFENGDPQERVLNWCGPYFT